MISNFTDHPMPLLLAACRGINLGPALAGVGGG